MNSKSINIITSIANFSASVAFAALAFSQYPMFLIPAALFAFSGSVFLGLVLRKAK